LLALVAVVACGCVDTDQGGYAVLALNDSDSSVILDLHMGGHRTIELAAHSYATISGIDARLGLSPTISLVDGACKPITTLTVDQAHDLAYVHPDGTIELVNGDARSYGLGTAKAHDWVVSNAPCR
jgi:hypothetical protein